MINVDLGQTSRRELNARLHALLTVTNETLWRVANPAGQHALAVGIAASITVEIDGDVGYYCGGMNAAAEIIVHGNAGVGVAENMMSGSVRVHGDAS